MTNRGAASADALVPLKPDVFAILLVLLEGDAHGYAIMQRAASARPSVTLQPGALYRLLKRMLDDGLIEELDLDTTEDGRRRSYRVTELGHDVAAAEAQRMSDLVSASRRRDLLQDPESA